jgi:acyl carrier protein
MSDLDFAEVKRFICELYEEPLTQKGYALDKVPDELDLLQSGVIDSLGILELISNLENRFQISIDLEHLPAEQLTVLGPLSQHVANYSIKSAPTSDRVEFTGRGDP